MPTNPAAPNTNASVDRLALGVDSPRGTEPSFPVPMCPCFEAEASGLYTTGSPVSCFEAEASGIPGGCYACSCFESE